MLKFLISIISPRCGFGRHKVTQSCVILPIPYIVFTPEQLFRRLRRRHEKSSGYTFIPLWVRVFTLTADRRGACDVLENSRRSVDG